MRSPGNSLRPWFEGALHALAVLLLAAGVFSAWREQSRGGSEERVRSPGLDSALARWSTVASPVAVEAALTHPPTIVERDWLAALPGAETSVTWTGANLTATALALLPNADPARSADLLIAAPDQSPVVLGQVRRDTARAIDGALRLNLPMGMSGVSALVGGLESSIVPADSIELKRLLVLGRAGWESKFTIAALEERGWIVDAHLALAPGGDVAQGVSAKAGGSSREAAEAPVVAPAAPPSRMMGRGTVRTFADQAAALAVNQPHTTGEKVLPIAVDTARYAAVIALDSVAAREGARIGRFVHSGGGLLLWPEAAQSLSSLAAGESGTLIGDPTRHAAGVVTLDSLLLHPLVDLRPDAVALARRGTAVTVAGRRIGPGRVVQLGYDDLWRWRMAGAAGSAEQHRAWIARMVQSVAFAPAHSLDAPPGDAAPLAALVDRLGAPSPSGLPLAAAFAGVLNVWTFSLLSGALLVEWLSRRLRSRP